MAEGHLRERRRVRVAAVTVTYDRPNVLLRCLDAIQQQTRPPLTVVVDNGNSDFTDRALAEGYTRSPGDPEIATISMNQNSGPGGGFSRGSTEAVERFGPTHLWLMDDDVFPEPDAMESLLAAGADDAWDGGIIHWPRVITTYEEENNRPGWSGFLMSAELVTRHGTPRADVVWWAEDTEYRQWCLQERAGVTMRRVDGARVPHATQARESVPPTWKIYYEGRNAVFLRLHLERHDYWRLTRLRSRASGGAWDCAFRWCPTARP